jgi:hypothetical protein
VLLTCTLVCAAALLAESFGSLAELSSVAVRAAAARTAGKYGFVASTNGGEGEKAVCAESIVMGVVPDNGVVPHTSIMVDGVECTGTANFMMYAGVKETAALMDGAQRAALYKVMDTFYVSGVDEAPRTCGTFQTTGAYFFTDNMPGNRAAYIKYFLLDQLSLPLTSPGDTFMVTLNRVGDRIKPCWYKNDGDDTPPLPTPVPGDPACFPAAARVELDDGSSRTMGQLSVGDRVKVGAGAFSDVFMFTHRTADIWSPFVTLSTASGEALSLSPGHYLQTSAGLVAAGTVKAGDVVTLGSGESTAVTAVSTGTRRGLYNPQTVSGSIVVDGIVASTYTAAVEPALAHTLLAPFRAAYRWAGMTTSMLEAGSPGLSSLVPSGPPTCAL